MQGLIEILLLAPLSEQAMKSPRQEGRGRPFDRDLYCLGKALDQLARVARSPSGRICWKDVKPAASYFGHSVRARTDPALRGILDTYRKRFLRDDR
jgi:hypothetical protein